MIDSHLWLTLTKTWFTLPLFGVTRRDTFRNIPKDDPGLCNPKRAFRKSCNLKTVKMEEWMNRTDVMVKKPDIPKTKMCLEFAKSKNHPKTTLFSDFFDFFGHFTHVCIQDTKKSSIQTANLNLMIYLLEQSEWKNINFENSYGQFTEGGSFQKFYCKNVYKKRFGLYNFYFP